MRERIAERPVAGAEPPQHDLLPRFQPPLRDAVPQPDFALLLVEEQVDDLADHAGLVGCFVERSAGVFPHSVLFGQGDYVGVEQGAEIVVEAADRRFRFVPVEVDADGVLQRGLEDHASAAEPVFVVDPPVGVEVERG